MSMWEEGEVVGYVHFEMPPRQPKGSREQAGRWTILELGRRPGLEILTWGSKV